MSIKELTAISDELVAGLRRQARDGNAQAAGILLKHLRGVSKDIDKWKRDKTVTEAERAARHAHAADDGPNRSRHG